MKTYIFFLASLVLTVLTANAKTKNKVITNTATTAYFGGYGNSFIFHVNGVEFSVFKDGQFDFNLLNNNAQLRVNISNRHSNISFNSGYNYNAFVQYDEFGAIIQIENIPIYYDYFGRISQAGNIAIQYNSYGFINRVGGLNIFYRNQVFSHHTGFINTLNRGYISRPWHRYYSIPTQNFCVVYNRPYRQFYNPVRYTYIRGFQNNYRPRTAIANRRGNTISRNRHYATVNRNTRNVTQINRSSTSRRSVANNNIRTSRRSSTLANRRIIANNNIERQSVTRRSGIITINSKRPNNQNITRTNRNTTRTNTRTGVVKRSQRLTNIQTSRNRNTHVKSNARVNKPRIIQQRTISVSPQKNVSKATQSRSHSRNNTRSTTTRRRT